MSTILVCDNCECETFKVLIDDSDMMRQIVKMICIGCDKEYTPDIYARFHIEKIDKKTEEKIDIEK